MVLFDVCACVCVYVCVCVFPLPFVPVAMHLGTKLVIVFNPIYLHEEKMDNAPLMSLLTRLQLKAKEKHT